MIRIRRGTHSTTLQGDPLARRGTVEDSLTKKRMTSSDTDTSTESGVVLFDGLDIVGFNPVLMSIMVKGVFYPVGDT